MNIIKKIKLLFFKCKNPGYFIYQVFHYAKCYVPTKLAVLIANCNNDMVDSECGVIFHTYDGSQQACHPDMTMFSDKLWIAFTPYPYGMDEYENPVVYEGNSFEELETKTLLPIDTPTCREYGYHLSDPCIAENGNELFCFYRESRRNEQREKDINALYFQKFDPINERWCVQSKIMQSDSMQLLSPAFIFGGKECFCYFAEWADGQLMFAKLKEGILTCFSTVVVNNLPKDYCVWHLAIAYSDNHTKFSKSAEQLDGLFLIRSKILTNNFKLMYAYSAGVGEPWHIKKEVILPESIQKKIKTIYKSCFISNTNDILVSYRDVQDRYCFVKIERSEQYESC